MLGRLRALIRKAPLASVLGSAMLLGVVGLVVGAAGPAGENTTLKNEKAALTKERDAALGEVDALSGDLENAQFELDTANEKLDALGDLRARRRELTQAISRLEGKVRDERAKLVAATNEVAKSTISDGTWQLNVDFTPGTYKAEGGDACYWEKLSGPSGDGIDGIIENGGFTPNQIVSVDSPYFKTSNCGTWTRTG